MYVNSSVDYKHPFEGEKKSLQRDCRVKLPRPGYHSNGGYMRQ